ncbi:unnamed protein product [Cyclocybe aegerita]|uniref:Uncharacterized protein n=1 Tax=Cyclocybe aegerita TaxID=1973307 RepID=A0A8S0VY41_CYCAE|nr:unnamed protein product [Cyclocybe aegerita]
MDVDTPDVERQSAGSSPDTQYSPNSSALQPYAEQDSLMTITTTDSTSSFPISTRGSLNSPSALLSPVTTLTRASTRPAPASDRALAALSLALANGAGSIADYSAVQRYQEGLQADSYDIGDLWR